MANIRQKKRTQRLRIPKTSKKRAIQQKKVSLRLPDILAEEWQKDETVSENYKRFGLTAKFDVNFKGGEQEKSSGQPREKQIIRQARVVKDANGKILEILDDLTNDSDSLTEGVKESSKVVAELQSQAQVAEVSKQRFASSNERQWVEALIQKHGDDYEAMFKDKKLNVRQQSIGDIRRRINRWKETNP